MSSRSSLNNKRQSGFDTPLWTTSTSLFTNTITNLTKSYLLTNFIILVLLQCTFQGSSFKCNAFIVNSRFATFPWPSNVCNTYGLYLSKPLSVQRDGSVLQDKHSSKQSADFQSIRLKFKSIKSNAKRNNVATATKTAPKTFSQKPKVRTFLSRQLKQSDFPPSPYVDDDCAYFSNPPSIDKNVVVSDDELGLRSSSMDEECAATQLSNATTTVSDSGQFNKSVIIEKNMETASSVISQNNLTGSILPEPDLANPHHDTTLVATSSELMVENKTINTSYKEETLLSNSSATPSLSPSTRLPVQKKRIWNNDELIELKQSVDIVDVVGEFGLDKFVRLRSGKFDNARALCPFHNDINPSLSIDGGKQIFRCFACGVSGDVFGFVKEYSSRVNGQAISFQQAARRVAEKFSLHPERFPSLLRPSDRGLSTWKLDLSSSIKMPRLTEDEKKEWQYREIRIFIANAAAAAFYASCLTQLSAGVARIHLKNRGLMPSTARHFVLGFAPDSYYHDNEKSAPSSWGQGSLVEYLRASNFTCEEILAAGLAIKTKKLSASEEVSLTQDYVDSSGLLYSNLMDRFRGRLVIPIYDKTGKNILGFGARSLPMPNEQTSMFYNPKYLNTPESTVFEKRKILFGHNLVMETFRRQQVMSYNRFYNAASFPHVIMVEGYMDAIALWAIGMNSVVATMGTAISRDQLSLAASILSECNRGSKQNIHNGRVVLCMDNDEAGLSSMERICSNGMLKEVTTQSKTSFYIARLPDGIKDPGAFTENISGSAGEKAQKFYETVLNEAVGWTDWYIQRIIKDYDSQAQESSVGSFKQVFSRIASFLADTMDAAECTKSALKVGGIFTELLSKELSVPMVSLKVQAQVQAQLQEALLEESFKIAKKNSELQRRIKLSDSKTTLASLTSGGMSEGTEEDESEFTRKLAMEQRNKLLSTSSSFERANNPMLLFKYKSDVVWLNTHTLDENFEQGYPKKKNFKQRYPELVLGTYGIKTNNKLVRFGSSEYHGYQLLTDEARQAGYIAGEVKFDNEKGISSLDRPDLRKRLLQAENSLLRILICCGTSRKLLKSLIEARKTANLDVEVSWSSGYKKRLFESILTTSITCSASELRCSFSKRPDHLMRGFVSDNHEEEETNRRSVLQSCLPLGEGLNRRRFSTVNCDSLKTEEAHCETRLAAPEISGDVSKKDLSVSADVDFQSDSFIDEDLDYLFMNTSGLQDIDENAPLEKDMIALSELRIQHLFNSLLQASTAVKIEAYQQELYHLLCVLEQAQKKSLFETTIETWDKIVNASSLENTLKGSGFLDDVEENQCDANNSITVNNNLSVQSERKKTDLNAIYQPMAKEASHIRQLCNGELHSKDRENNVIQMLEAFGEQVPQLTDIGSVRTFSELQKAKQTLLTLIEEANHIRTKMLIKCSTSPFKSGIFPNIFELDDFLNSDGVSTPSDNIEMSKIEEEWKEWSVVTNNGHYDSNKIGSKARDVPSNAYKMTNSRFDDNDKERIEEFGKRVGEDYALYEHDVSLLRAKCKIQL